jgi:hypothetical protein
VAAEGRLGEVGSARLVPRILDRLLMSGSSPIVKGSRLCGYSRDGWMHHGGYEITDLVSCPTVVKVQVPGGVEVFFQRLPPGSGEPLAGLSTRNEVWSQESFTYDFQPLLRILYREGSQARGFLFESLGSGDPRRRSLAACLLGTAGLAEALGHADERIRTAAREELERIEVLR